MENTKVIDQRNLRSPHAAPILAMLIMFLLPILSVLAQEQSRDWPDKKTEAKWSKNYKQMKTLMKAGDFKPALAAGLEALRIADANIGPEHTDLVTTLNDVSQVYIGLGQYDNAVPLLKRLVKLCEKMWGPHSQSFGTSLGQLGTAYYYLKKYPDAKASLKQAVTVLEKHLKQNNPQLVAYRGLLKEMSGKK